AIDESHGAVEIVTDAEILDAQKWLAANEGIFVEPASAAALAGLFKCASTIQNDARIVCTVTGHGLKDPDVATREMAEFAPVAANVSDVLRKIDIDT
ncbi:MAG: threonine synthase, partial [Verrucomicrobiota bacterium]